MKKFFEKNVKIFQKNHFCETENHRTKTKFTKQMLNYQRLKAKKIKIKKFKKNVEHGSKKWYNIKRQKK